VVGADEIKPSGSMVGCADDFAPSQWFDDDDVWTNNSCDGTQNSAPVYF
jgi:hypothetical protein